MRCHHFLELWRYSKLDQESRSVVAEAESGLLATERPTIGFVIVKRRREESELVRSLSLVLSRARALAVARSMVLSILLGERSC